MMLLYDFVGKYYPYRANLSINKRRWGEVLKKGVVAGIFGTNCKIKQIVCFILQLVVYYFYSLFLGKQSISL